MVMKVAQYNTKTMFLIVNGFSFQEGKRAEISVEQIWKKKEKEAHVCSGGLSGSK